jgi:hypothetical protein
MTEPADPEPPRPDDTKPRSAHPGRTGVVPPSPTGTPRWRRPAMVGAAIVVILLLILLLA